MVAMTLGWLYEWANCFTLMAELAEATLTTAVIPLGSILMSTYGETYSGPRERAEATRAKDAPQGNLRLSDMPKGRIEDSGGTNCCTPTKSSLPRTSPGSNGCRSWLACWSSSPSCSV